MQQRNNTKVVNVEKNLFSISKTIMAWDLGATKCTAGIVELDPLSQDFICNKHYTIKLAETKSLEDLISQIESKLGCAMSQMDAICIGAAGQFNGEYLFHANKYSYSMPFANIAKLQHWPAYAVIHDYSSIICATFTSYMENPANIKRLNKCKPQTYGRRVALGVGTGLGLKDGVLLTNGDFWLGRNEIGHIGITTPPEAQADHLKRHQEIMYFLQKKNANAQSITFEKILAGQGIVNLYHFFHPNSHELTPEEIGQLLHKGKASEVLHTFAWYLGLFVGTVQLTFMPEGGIWITGGVTLNHLDLFDSTEFFAGIHASPAYHEQRESYPLGVLCNHHHALIGNGYYAMKRLF